jgi:hypothetical protein
VPDVAVDRPAEPTENRAEPAVGRALVGMSLQWLFDGECMTLKQSRILFLTAIGILVFALAGPLTAEDANFNDKARFEWPAPRSRAHIVVAPLLKAKAPAEAPFSVEIVPPDNLPTTSFIRIQGLPEPVSLSAGQAVAAGTWTVPVLSLGNLTINVSGKRCRKVGAHHKPHRSRWNGAHRAKERACHRGCGN